MELLQETVTNLLGRLRAARSELLFADLSGEEGIAWDILVYQTTREQRLVQELKWASDLPWFPTTLIIGSCRISME